MDKLQKTQNAIMSVVTNGNIMSNMGEMLRRQFSYNVTIYLTVLWRAAPALNQNLRSRVGGALTPIFKLRAERGTLLTP